MSCLFCDILEAWMYLGEHSPKSLMSTTRRRGKGRQRWVCNLEWHSATFGLTKSDGISSRITLDYRPPLNEPVELRFEPRTFRDKNNQVDHTPPSTFETFWTVFCVSKSSIRDLTFLVTLRSQNTSVADILVSLDQLQVFIIFCLDVCRLIGTLRIHLDRFSSPPLKRFRHWKECAFRSKDHIPVERSSESIKKGLSQPSYLYSRNVLGQEDHRETWELLKDLCRDSFTCKYFAGYIEVPGISFSKEVGVPSFLATKGV